MQKSKGGRNQSRGRDDRPQATESKMGPCKSRNFVAIDDPEAAEYADYQEIKVQETFKTLRPGLIPRSIAVILQNTLVESVKPGDDVMLTGVLMQRWKQMPPQSATRPLVDLALTVNNVEVLNKRDF